MNDPILQAALLHDKVLTVHHFATVSKFILPLNSHWLDTPFYVQILILIVTYLLCSLDYQLILFHLPD
jgi:hypothetical protein